MDRGKHIATTSKRGVKSKSLSHVHGDLIALGSKTSSDIKHLTSQYKSGSLKSEHRKHDLSSSVATKKPKLAASTSGSILNEKVDSPKRYQRAELDAWREVAVEPPAASELVRAVVDADQNRAEALLCGCVLWQLSNQRSRLDQVLSISLLLLVKCHPSVFCSEHVIAALCSLLRREGSAGSSGFKGRTNGQVQVLACNLLYAVFREETEWPEVFVSVYLEDASGDRLWVDSEDCRVFVDNILTAFGTRSPPKNLLQPDITLSGRTVECPSPPVTGSSAMDDTSVEASVTSNQSGSEAETVKQRFLRQKPRIREMTFEYVKELIGSRRQTVETVSRNILRLLAVVCGVPEVRHCVVFRLEVWLQNPKWSRPAQELLVSLCCNLNSPHQFDTEVISQLVKFRLKAKPIINLYLNCMRELLVAHSANLSPLLKHTIYNELSQSRNPHNMAVLSAIFQHSHSLAASALADVFIELLMNREDYYQRALRPLWREICRSLRYDVDLSLFCSYLLQTRDDKSFGEFEFRERYVTSICDLISLSILLSVSPAVRECVSVRGGEHGDHTALVSFHKQASLIQLNTLKWLHETAPSLAPKGWPDMVHCVYKVLFMEPVEVYYRQDNWPPETDRVMMLRIASDVPALQESLLRVMLIGLSKLHAVQANNALEVVENMVRRSALCHHQTDGASTLTVDNLDIIDLLFNLCLYQHPQNISLPEGFQCPQLAVQESYWRVWTILLLITAHNPQQFGKIAWQHYDTLQMLIEMCITNSFTFPPPTLATGERTDEILAKERQTAATEVRHIIEYETVLAAASTGQTITESNSLLLAQLISLQPTGPPRRPSVTVLQQLRQLNSSLHVGQLLCTSRQPDFLLDILNRQENNQNMPWLSDLVTQSVGSLHRLPVQCLCEFLLSKMDGGDMDEIEQTVHSRYHELLTHLKSVVRRFDADHRACSELMEYFLRRLSSQLRQARLQAVRGFRLVLQPVESQQSSKQPFNWLLHHLPDLPHFTALRQGAVHGLRIACHYETDPDLVGAYIEFLAQHSAQDVLEELNELVIDFSQLIVERSCVMARLLPTAEMAQGSGAHSALLQVFTRYTHLLLQTKPSVGWQDSGDQLVVRWASGDTCTISSLVVHATVILLCHRPPTDTKSFSQLQQLWFPSNAAHPQPIDGSALLPDWLKLRMVRSANTRLVDAAVSTLVPAQLVLFIQSFGVPVASMCRLVGVLDSMADSEPAAVLAAVLNRQYMLQLLEVQRLRGVPGGHVFAALLRADSSRDDDAEDAERSHESVVAAPRATCRSLPATAQPVTALAPSRARWLVGSVFCAWRGDGVQQRHGVRSLVRGVALEQRHCQSLITRAVVGAFTSLLATESSFVGDLHAAGWAAACLLRLLSHARHVLETDELRSELLSVCTDIHVKSQGIEQCHSLMYVCGNFRQRYGGSRGGDLPSSPQDSAEQRVESVVLSGRSNRLQYQLSDVIDDSVRAGKSRCVVAALWTGLLARSEEASCGRIGLLVDWLELLQPDVVDWKQPRQLRALFARQTGFELSSYLLAVFAHRADCVCLHTTLDALLTTSNTCGEYDARAVLDLWRCCDHVPRLWRGREHSGRENRVAVRGQVPRARILVECVVSEAAQYEPDLSAVMRCISGRLRLVLDYLGSCRSLLEAALKQAWDLCRSDSSSLASSAERLLLLLYVKRPSIVCVLPQLTEFLHKTNCLDILTSEISPLDFISHNLLTALAARQTGKETASAKDGYELALRKLASSHPFLLLRQLPLMVALLRGRMHVESSVFRQRNEFSLFSRFLGILELVRPHLSSSCNEDSLLDLLGVFLDTVNVHHQSVRELSASSAFVSRLVSLITTLNRQYATTIQRLLASHEPLLLTLSRLHPECPLLRSLSTTASSHHAACTLPTGEHEWASSDLGLAARLQLCGSEEERVSALNELDVSSSRCPTLLDSCCYDLCALTVGPDAPVRRLAYSLLQRHLCRDPAAAGRLVSWTLRCIYTGSMCVRADAVRQLPWLVLLAQEEAVTLLQAAFEVGLNDTSVAAQHVSDAIVALNLQAGL